ncbi:MAG TPA: AAA family ATPase [Clostridiales bacterium]|nr:AAA family ATPase [Clostridiales bacterium]
MYIHSISLKNYKSIGEKKSSIILEPRVTTIIGKNESGKSNVLEGISHISLLSGMQTAFNTENINRNNGINANIEYTITLKPTSEDQKTFNIFGDTKIILDKDSYIATGSVLTYYNEHIRESVDTLVSIMGQNPFQLRDQDFTNFRTYISDFQQTDSLNLLRINLAFTFIETQNSRLNKENRDAVSEALSESKSKWGVITSVLPVVFYRNADKILKTQYKLEEVQKELASPKSFQNSLLADFVHLIQVSDDEFIKAVSSGTTGTKTSIRKKINRNVETMINKSFQDFYTEESISLNVDFDSSTVSFSVQSGDGETMLLSERSNGLRWYLNMFIDALAHGLYKNNVVYLFDEPGTSLHVNAQKELINLFHALANKGNQVVYTTHSPYMLDMKEDGIHRIRAVEKDSEGYSYIYKTAYDSQLSPDSQEDTLAPIVNAIGMNLGDRFGPSVDKLNIVVEGISDYIYLHTMAKQLGYDLNEYAFIPSVGATNCINICTILYGWGCPFFAVFDYDKEGVTKGGEILRKDFLYEYEKHYCYIKTVTQDDVDNKTFIKAPCVIEDIVTKNELDKFSKEKGIAENISKPLLAKLFSNSVEDGSHNIGEQCKNNFADLLTRINKIYKTGKPK